MPSNVDYDLWCGPADQEPICRPKLHYDWHWDYNTGAGDMGNQGIHQMDIARWFLGEDQLPPRVLSIGGRVGYEDCGESANTQLVYCDYPNAPLQFDTRGLPSSRARWSDWGRSMDSYRGSQIGVIVQCDGGHLYAPNTYDVVTAYDTSGRLIKEFKRGGDHYANFLSAVSAGDDSMVKGNVTEGHVSSALCHLGNESHQLGREATAGELPSELASNELLGAAFDRMADHLRANKTETAARPSCGASGSTYGPKP
ncbi:MAG: hypothetical protein AAGJ46_11085 [Planctomycetota bacterium]